MLRIGNAPLVRPVPPVPPVPLAANKGDTDGPGLGNVPFGAVLAQALDAVNATQLEATAADAALASGQLPDMAAAVIASEKATMALELLVEVRNKVVEAYQEIMRMPL